MNFFKRLYVQTRDDVRATVIAAALIALCIICLYSIEQVQHLNTRLALAERQLLYVKQEQDFHFEEIQQVREANEIVDLHVGQMSSNDMRRDLNIVTLTSDTHYLEQYIQAVHSCFLVHNFAEASEDICFETGEQYYCQMWSIYETMCMNVDEEGNLTLPPEFEVYNKIMLFYLGNEESQ